MIEKMLDKLVLGLWNLIQGLTGISQMMIYVSFIIILCAVLITRYFYKEVKAANAKTLEVIKESKVEQRIIMEEHKKDYVEMNNKGMELLGEVKESIKEHSTTLRELRGSIEVYTTVTKELIKKVS